MKSFRLSKSHSYLNVFLATFSTLLVITIFKDAIWHNGRFDREGYFPAVFVMMALGYGWYGQVLRMVRGIVVRDDGFVEFKSWVGSRVVRMSDIQSIHSEFYSHGGILVRHSRGTIRLLYNIDGMHEFIWILRTMNPQVVTWDC